ncbi:LAGLIDADG family homing endonuclease [Candidatus Omnitrophota bacterium]
MPRKRKDLKIEGANLWYLVGLITSDGCLSSDGRHIDITTSEREFLEGLKNRLKLVCKIGIKNKGMNNQAYRFQIANKNFYDFLLSIGLTPSKSLTIKELAVPDEYFTDFLRGLIDGDGCIRSWVHPANKREQWDLRIYSGSSKFLGWLGQMIGVILKARGKIYRHNKQGSCCVLKFGKMAARQIIQQCYCPGSFSLARKHLLAEECINSNIGWERSKTTDSLEFA